MSRSTKEAEKKKNIPKLAHKMVRADAQRNVASLLRAASSVFAKSGIDAPVREIAEKAGVGTGTLYRHFPERSDLIKAVVQQEVDDCAAAAKTFAAEHEAGEAFALWMQRLVDLLATKRGLGPALHSGHPSYQSLPEYFMNQLTPALENLLNAAKASGAIRVDVKPRELLMAGTRLATPASEGDIPQARRMVALLVDGMRFGNAPLGEKSRVSLDSERT